MCQKEEGDSLNKHKAVPIHMGQKPIANNGKQKCAQNHPSVLGIFLKLRVKDQNYENPHPGRTGFKNKICSGDP